MGSRSAADDDDAPVAMEDVARARGFELIARSVYVPPMARPHAVETDLCFCSRPDTDDDGTCCDETCINVATYTECPRGRCPSGSACRNQRLQRPESFPTLEAFKTESKGYGVRTRVAIERNDPIGEYVGEIIDQKELQRRCAGLGRHETNFYYIQVEPGVFNDARHRGGFTRFVNHSCDPNCKVEKWIVDGEMRFLVYALRAIAPMEEITFDYQWQVIGTMRITCHCGAATCSGYIGEDVALPEAHGVFKEPTDADQGFQLVHRKIRVFESHRDDAPFRVLRVVEYDPETARHHVQVDDASATETINLSTLKYQVYLDFEGLSDDEIRTHIFSIPKVQRPPPRRRTTRWDVKTPVNIEAPAASPPPEPPFVAKASPLCHTKLFVKNLDKVCNEEYFRRMLGGRASTLVSFDAFEYDAANGSTWALLEFSDAKVYDAMRARLDNRRLASCVARVIDASERDVQHYEKTKFFGRPSRHVAMSPVSPPPPETPRLSYAFGRNLHWFVKDVSDSPSRRHGMSPAVEHSLREKCTNIILKVAMKLRCEREDNVAAIVLFYRYISIQPMNASTIEWVAAACLHVVLKCHARSIDWQKFTSCIYAVRYPGARIDAADAMRLVSRQLLAMESVVLEGVMYDVSSQDPYSLLDFYMKRRGIPIAIEVQKDAKYLLADSLSHTLWMQCSIETIVLGVLYVASAHDSLKRTDAAGGDGHPSRPTSRYPVEVLPAVEPKYFGMWSAATRTLAKFFSFQLYRDGDAEVYWKRLLARLELWSRHPDFSADDKARKYPPLDRSSHLPPAGAVKDSPRLLTTDMERAVRIRKRSYLATVRANVECDLANRDVYLQPWPYRDPTKLVHEETGIVQVALQEIATVMNLHVLEPSLIFNLLGLVFPDPKAATKRRHAPSTDPELRTLSPPSPSDDASLPVGAHYLAFERPLHLYSSLLEAKVKIPYPIRKRAVLDLFRSVALCHDHNIVHRSISPSNLFVFKDGVKLGGFYNARHVNTKGDLSGGYALMDGEHCDHTHGTLLHVTAPEVLLGAKVYSKKADLWAAGCVAINILLGAPLICGKDWKKQIEYIFRICGSPPDEYAAGVDADKLAQCAPKEKYAVRIRKAIRERAPTFPDAYLPIFESLLDLDPKRRMAARKVLKSELFDDVDHHVDFDVFANTMGNLQDKMEAAPAKRKAGSSSSTKTQTPPRKKKARS
ncbi:CMGC/CDK protein kinase [Saprolegnia diclina VS20]|uniref:CMGC/CDK protein kinase n=1 Tax=Saprolegnia diclina (strain VS20) TaxID=1156394 RepID=T0QQA8_SAPDV|nr:CMGC/CDK protein kinase [Saprolegnia diclina VS20]EQC36926.1 CMGC/CDK protein kinase [Saprolegnia diclina VS20]|eukprot:XP_008609707.1 CMGC/CDK protein kinase [Saprolegnia diclina VS20]